MRRTLILSLALFAFAAGALQARTTIEWWQFWTDPTVKPVIQEMVKEFESANPDIEVKLTDLTWSHGHEKIVVAFASNTGPDIVELGSDWIAQFADGGYLADVSGSIAPDSNQFQGWGMATYKRKVWAQPWILGTRVLFYNRDLIQKAGLDKDFIPVNWPDLEAGCKAVDGLGKDIYGWGSNAAEKHRLYKKFLPFFWSAGAQIFIDDGEICVISSMYAIDALKYYLKLHQDYGYVADQRGIEDAFLDGKIGFIMSGDWLLKRINLENRKINLMTSVIPGPKYPGTSFLGGEFLAINAASEHKEAAMKFIKFMTSPVNQVRFCKANMSANPSSLEAQKDPYFTESPYLQTFIRQIKLAKHPPVVPDWVYIEDIIERAVENTLFNGGLPATELRNAQIRITRLRKNEQK